MRNILHSDCNSFYASAELAERPQLRGKPVAVCGDPALRHGIILAKSQETKVHGVLTGEAVWQAQRKCPGLILLPADHRKYALYARKMRDIYLRYTSRVEPFGMDEAGWTRARAQREEIAARLRKSAREELHITCPSASAPASPSPWARPAKPDATT